MATDLWLDLKHAAKLRLAGLRRAELNGSLAHVGPSHQERQQRLEEDASESLLTRKIAIKLVGAAAQQASNTVADEPGNAEIEINAPEEGFGAEGDDEQAPADGPLTESQLWQIKLAFLRCVRYASSQAEPPGA